MAMFQVPTRPAGHVHVEFKAGRMDWDGRMVTADKRKGKILLYTSEEDQLTHFQWMDRDKNEVVTDLIVINDAYMEKVTKCTSGRAYILRFTSSDKKMFFWMQEPSEDKDAENIKKFNEAIGATIPEKTEKKPAAEAAPAEAPAETAPSDPSGDAGGDPPSDPSAPAPGPA
ncbi:adrm1-b [Symbiodinium pilosum]|uniref:Adrm1-b protein n=1 Tax=Symbiodinium pilosum TaxID=2952 RepID=A0A812URG8_SYMPI|nr:adrm1-b [Symbiodinium pilosum]